MIGVRQSIKIIIPAILLTLLLSSPAWAWRAAVVKVIDGDTIVDISEHDGEKTKIPLYGVDTPETKN